MGVDDIAYEMGLNSCCRDLIGSVLTDDTL